MRPNYHIHNHNLIAYFFIFLTSFHVLRNLSNLYIIFYFFYVLSVYFLIFSEKASIKYQNRKILYSYIIFLFFTFWVALWSIIYNPEISIINTLGRFFFIIILPSIILPCKLTEENFTFILKIFIIIICIASLSYFYQNLFGPISWFVDEPMARGSIVRYATTLGSGNSYGVVVGIAIYITLTIPFKNSSKLIVSVILLMGAIMSVQKAAFVNIIIALTLALLTLKLKKSFLLIISAVFFIIILITFSYFNQENSISIYFQEFLMNTIAINIFDNADLIRTTYIDKEELLTRFQGLHFHEIIEGHELIIVLLLGIGATGAGGAMGVEDQLQSHNAFLDLFFMGGFLYVISFLILLSLTNYYLLKIKTKISKIFYYSNIIFFINIFSSSITMFHPSTAIIFWLSVTYAIAAKKQGLVT